MSGKDIAKRKRGPLGAELARGATVPVHGAELLSEEAGVTEDENALRAHIRNTILDILVCLRKRERVRTSPYMTVMGMAIVT